MGYPQSGFVQAARQAGFTVTGIETAASNLTQPKAGGPPAQSGDFTSGMFPPDHFDVITMWEILEQVPFPDLFLEEAFRILKPGGILAVSVPNYESLNIRVLGPKSRFLGCPHINCFSETSLGIFLEVHGFEVKTTQTKGLNLQGMWHDLRSQTESQPPHDPASPASHTQPAVFPFNLFHQGMDRLLGLLGLGERLLMSGTKHKL
ncbi:MAG: class I SAM-dependent methyltransferase [Blastocatellia bacterium]|nr:class I SAM-dependent methyltransferase [Blastocatellia bacterium]